jgi:hypothetical protein
VVCDDDDTAGEAELASPALPLRRPSEHLLGCFLTSCCDCVCGGPDDGNVATGAYTVLVPPDASPVSCCTGGCAAAAAAAAYSAGGTQMPPTTTNCGAGDAALVLLLWTAVEFGRLVCRRYF